MKHFLVAACAALLLSACGRQTELMSSMPEQEANDVLAALRNGGMDANKVPGKEGMVGVTVDSAEFGRAVEFLRTKGLPHARHSGMGQVFKKEGLISSPLEERARYLFALSQELNATLSQIDGVTVARVHVVLPERGIGAETQVPSSAAVFIKYQEGYNLDVLQPQIRRLVTNSIPGLTPEKISIVLFGVQPAPPTSAAKGASDIGSNLPLGAALVALLAFAAAGGFAGWRYLRARGLIGRTEAAT